MRNLSEVIDQLLEVIPESEQSLRGGLVKVQKKLGYKAPEQAHECWTEVALVLQSHIGDKRPTDGWQLQVADIWQDV